MELDRRETYLLLENGDPVCSRKPLVAFDIIDAIFQVTISLR